MQPSTGRKLLKRSVKQEQRTAQTYRGSRQPGSGAGWVRKNDVRSDQFLFENKLTQAKSYSFKKMDMVELTERAILEDRIPVFQIDISGNRYILLNEDDFIELVGDE